MNTTSARKIFMVSWGESIATPQPTRDPAQGLPHREGFLPAFSLAPLDDLERDASPRRALGHIAGEHPNHRDVAIEP